MPSAALLLQLSLLTGASLTVIKLLRTGLYHRYPVFTWYFVFWIAYSGWAILLDTRSQLYLKLFVLTTPITWVFYVLVLRELFSLILARHRGIYTLGRWAMYVACAVSILISILAMLPKITPALPQTSVAMVYMVAIGRGVDVSVVVFILLILLFLSSFPVPLNRNLAVHVIVFSAFFLSETLSAILRTVFGRHLIEDVNLLLMVSSAACTWAWFFLLTPKGEEIRVNLPWLAPQNESRLLSHLDALNATLLGTARR
jgi:hypothetical protein